MSVTPEEQTQRDIAAALADLRGRRDQAVAELDERINQLESLAESFQSGAVDARAAQDRVRRLIGERGNKGMATPVRAGRTQIGMRMGSEQTPVNAPNVTQRALGPTPTIASASLNRALSAVDARIVTVLSQPIAQTRDEARLELALLRRLRRSIVEQLGTRAEDVIFLQTMVEFAEEAVTTVGELEQPGVERARRILQYDRELVGQLTATGAPVPGLKEQIQKARAMLETADPKIAQAMQEAVATFTRAHAELNRRFPNQASVTLLDELLR